jgi:4-amino-4-deoxy-L-arabinose transferase-like glycosyltransferase
MSLWNEPTRVKLLSWKRRQDRMGKQPMFSSVRNGYPTLFVVFLASLFIRLWLLNKRWIDVDEGAHLMDAVLALDGKIPLVDYLSREPLYVYSYAGFLKLFGTDFASARLLPAVCSLLVGFVIFILAKTLFDSKTALLSSAIYWMLPLELVQSVKVTTEPLVSLLTCLSFYSVAKFSLCRQRHWLVIAGVFAALSFYARNSALIVPITVFAFMVLHCQGRAAPLAKNLGLFLAGYGAVVLLVWVYYSKFMSPKDLLLALSLNPMRYVPWAVQKLLSSDRPVSESPFFWSRELYTRYLIQAVYLHSFLLIGLAFSVVQFAYHLVAGSREWKKHNIHRYSILYLWVLSLSAAYVFYFYVSGFIIDYSREFLPPLVIILSAWICSSVAILSRDGVLERFVYGGLCLSAVLFFGHAYQDYHLRMGHHAPIAIAMIALFSFVGTFESSGRRLVFALTCVGIVALIVASRRSPLSSYVSGTIPSLAMIGAIYAVSWASLEARVRESWWDYASFVRVSIVLGALVVSVSYSGRLLGLTYNAEWSPELVRKVASYVKGETDEADEVISGAVIWEFQALRRPFGMVSHPFGLEFATKDEKAAIGRAVAMRPPKVIILDGWTERLYVRHVPALTGLLAERYRVVPIAGPGAFPVRVYLRNEVID